MTKDEIISRLNDINADLVTEIDQLKQQRDEATRCLHWSNGEILALRQQRDEARKAACAAVSVYLCAEDPAEFEAWLDELAYPRWPWLKEKPGDHEEPPGRK